MAIPRHAAGPRQVARAAEIWRLFQELALRATVAAGWPPERYLEVGTAFVVHGLSGRHLREVRYGQRLRAQTWVQDFRRATLTRRQLRLLDEQGLVAEGVQQWVHTDAELRPVAASRELVEAFPCEPERGAAPPLDLPAAPVEDPGASFELEVWHTWMDPLAHLNHPAWLDLCDEGTMRRLAAAGGDPQALVPLAEELVFKRGAVAGQRLQVQTRAVGLGQGGAVLLEHEVLGPDGLCLRARTWRRTQSGPALAVLLGLRGPGHG